MVYGNEFIVLTDRFLKLFKVRSIKFNNFFALHTNQMIMMLILMNNFIIGVVLSEGTLSYEPTLDQ
jgi:hypothetical protein